MNLFMTNMPSFVRREVEQLQQEISPLAKKVSKYMLWTLPLITISIFNLFVLIFVVPSDEQLVSSLIIYSVLGALGMALMKETKIQKKEIEQLCIGYIIERITKSKAISEYSKKEFITLIKKQPLAAINHFVNFLIEEDRTKREHIN
jgi:hypothetical protein